MSVYLLYKEQWQETAIDRSTDRQVTAHPSRSSGRPAQAALPAPLAQPGTEIAVRLLMLSSPSEMMVLFYIFTGGRKTKPRAQTFLSRAASAWAAASVKPTPAQIPNSSQQASIARHNTYRYLYTHKNLLSQVYYFFKDKQIP